MYDKVYKQDSLIRIAGKPIGKYLTAITMKLEKYDTVEMTAFGQNLDMAFELAEKATSLFPVEVQKIESFTQINGDGREHKGIRVVLKKLL